jgi:hypothetical protein
MNEREVKMFLFICWSGEKSKIVATAFDKWIKKVIQAVEPWMSTEMERGARWMGELTEKLEKSKVGIIVLTKDNLESDWVLYEAGALSKFKGAHACTLLVDLKPDEIRLPLGQFQHTLSTKADIFELVKTINGEVRKDEGKALEEKILEEVFEINWPSLKEAIEEAESLKPSVSKPPKQGLIVAEILEYVRQQATQLSFIQKALESDTTARQNWLGVTPFAMMNPAYGNLTRAYNPSAIQEVQAAMEKMQEQIGQQLQNNEVRIAQLLSTIDTRLSKLEK